MVILQVINDRSINRVSIRELAYNEKPKGREAFYHPDCIIFVKGAVDHLVNYNLMLALQDRHMSVRALRYIGKRKK